jgi:hypothetical protein
LRNSKAVAEENQPIAQAMTLRSMQIEEPNATMNKLSARINSGVTAALRHFVLSTVPPVFARLAISLHGSGQRFPKLEKVKRPILQSYNALTHPLLFCSA